MYKIDRNKGGSRHTRRSFTLNTSNDNSSRSIGTPNYDFYELEPAEVIDIILDEDHPDFTNYADIGKAKIRFVYSETGKDDSLLSYAKPLDANIKNYPLKHEIVIAMFYMGELFYTQKMNFFNSVNENSYPNASLSFFAKKGSTRATAQEYESISNSGNPNVRKVESGNISLGNVFTRNNLIRPLKSFEGDVILEGRFGESIRFGSNQETGNPTIKIRAGQYEDVPEESNIQIIEEDINNDQSSIWLSSDEEISINPSTVDSGVHLQFYEDRPDVFDGSQIVFNSDRIVVNTKQNEFMVFAKKAINFVTEGILTIDSEDDITMNTLRNVVINSPRIYIGNGDADEPIVLGETLRGLLEDLIDLLLTHIHPTGTGPSSPMIPPESNRLVVLKDRLITSLSTRNFSK